MTNQQIITNVKKMNTAALANKFERTFGWRPFNVFEDRQMMISSMTQWLIDRQNGMTVDQSRQSAVAATFASIHSLIQVTANFKVGLVISFKNQIEKKTGGKFSDEVVRLIRELRNVHKMIYREIAKITGVSDNMCCAIATGISYKDVI